ncbi:WAX2 C-terminal domain [Musa troglodytarum]|uniref:WAX2 C-terminal domain n=1 Tax=Musa troglodytarum TaxID=320322 RepID=A0A9E7EIB9_9LILI|nr:WAX2 C-terminal domain [Musa troglodytarum]
MSVCCGCWRSPSLLRGSIARLPLVIVRLVAYRLHNYKAADGSRGSGEPSVFVRILSSGMDHQRSDRMTRTRSMGFGLFLYV